MLRTRRVLVLIAAASTLLVGLGMPASAAFSSTPTLPRMTLGTLTVEAPAAVDASASYCNNGVLQADVVWRSSGSRGVSGYTVTAHYRSGGTRVIAETDAGATRMTGVVPNQGLSTATGISVTTRTAYGWVATSPVAPVPPC